MSNLWAYAMPNFEFCFGLAWAKNFFSRGVDLIYVQYWVSAKKRAFF